MFTRDGVVLSNLITQTATTNKRIILQLAITKKSEDARRHIAYFNLFLTSAICRIACLGVKGPDVAVRIADQVRELEGAAETARKQMLHLNSVRITRADGGPLQCWHDDDGTTLACTERFGYQIDGDGKYRGTSVATCSPGGPAAIKACNAEKAAAMDKLTAAMQAQAILLTEASWEPFELALRHVRSAATTDGA